jgi:hypothetical protein
MKLGKSVLIELIAIFQDGLVNGKDISQSLRELDLGPQCGWANVNMIPSTLELTVEYVQEHPRATDWEEPSAGDAPAAPPKN